MNIYAFFLKSKLPFHYKLFAQEILTQIIHVKTPCRAIPKYIIWQCTLLSGHTLVFVTPQCYPFTCKISPLHCPSSPLHCCCKDDNMVDITNISWERQKPPELLGDLELHWFLQNRLSKISYTLKCFFLYHASFFHIRKSNISKFDTDENNFLLTEI